jgi:hypothetical protein
MEPALPNHVMYRAYYPDKKVTYLIDCKTIARRDVFRFMLKLWCPYCQVKDVFKLDGPLKELKAMHPATRQNCLQNGALVMMQGYFKKLGGFCCAVQEQACQE